MKVTTIKFNSEFKDLLELNQFKPIYLISFAMRYNIAVIATCLTAGSPLKGLRNILRYFSFEEYHLQLGLYLITFTMISCCSMDADSAIDWMILTVCLLTVMFLFLQYFRRHYILVDTRRFYTQ